KFNVVRAKAFKAGALSSETATRSFIVDPKGAGRYTLPVISLVTDPKNFFDPNIGIYVPGNAPGGNYAQSGDAWERPVHVEMFEPDGRRVISQSSGIRIHGNTSFGAPIKGLRLHPLNPPGNGPFKYPIFPDLSIQQFNRLLLRPSGQDYNLTFLRDVFMQSFGAEMGLDVQAYRPAVVFLDGEYWGLHNVQEAYEEGYFASHHGVDPDAVDYLEGFVFANEGDTAAWDAMMNFLNTHDLSQPTNYATLQTMMEVANYIDYKVCEIYFYRWDIGNHRPWRPRTPEGRFRWILFDCDVGWGGFWAVPPAWAFPMLAYDLEPNGPWTQYEQNPGGNDHNAPIVTFLLRSLTNNASFRRDFINRFADVLKTTFDAARVIRRIDDFSGRIAPEMREHVQRWRAPASVAVWSNNVQYLRDFAVQRPAFMQQQLTNVFRLPGTVTVTLRVNDTNAGSIRVSTLTVAPATNAPWTGTYFKDNPLTFTALANPGYTFVRWTGLLDPSNSVTLALLGNVA
ncbi:MAG TPA: CotH kinase family protein, partial [Candidatus Binatia bacterium]|nr:CotH kinase family protein [Candidatus Binatia bacterium]